MLPKDPFILLSFVNTKLRDQYSSLDLLCEDLDENKEELLLVLNEVDYYYDENKNQFITRH